jgi:hypothetical protein
MKNAIDQFQRQVRYVARRAPIRVFEPRADRLAAWDKAAQRFRELENTSE